MIVDEIHAVAADKRGAHLALSLERLDALARRPLQRIGLSATQKPIEEVARLLVGAGRLDRDGAPRCAIVDAGHRRDLDLCASRRPTTSSARSPATSCAPTIYERIAAARARATARRSSSSTRAAWSSASRTRSASGSAKARSPRITAACRARLASRPRRGSSRERSRWSSPPRRSSSASTSATSISSVTSARRARSPRCCSASAAPATSSAPCPRASSSRSRATISCSAPPRCAPSRRRARPARRSPRTRSTSSPSRSSRPSPAARSASRSSGELVRRAYPFRDLERERLRRRARDARRGRRRPGAAGAPRTCTTIACTAACAARRGARLAAITGGGAIPDTADYDVVEDATGTFVGKVNEDFAIESMAGDIFLLGNRSWRIRRVEAGTRARRSTREGAPPTIPFWLGEAPARTRGAVRGGRRSAARGRRAAARPGAARSAGSSRRRRSAAARRADRPLRRRDGRPCSAPCRRSTRSSPSASSTRPAACSSSCTRRSAAASTAPSVSRCASASACSFDFELQAAATDDGIVLSLGEQHSFPLDERLRHGAPADASRRTSCRPRSPRRCSPTAGAGTRRARSRCCAHTGGRSACRCRSSACAPRTCSRPSSRRSSPAATTARGPIEPPDHPLVNETLDNCLHEAMDADGLRARARGDRGGARSARSRSRRRRRRRCRTRSSTPTRTPSSTTRRSRSAAPAPCRCGGPIPTWPRGIGALDPAAIDEVRAPGLAGRARRRRGARRAADALLAAGARRRGLARVARRADRGRASERGERRHVPCLRRRRACRSGCAPRSRSRRSFARDSRRSPRLPAARSTPEEALRGDRARLDERASVR